MIKELLMNIQIIFSILIKLSEILMIFQLNILNMITVVKIPIKEDFLI